MDTFINLGAFAILAALWMAFAAALVLNRDLLTKAWRILRSWPIAVQLTVTFLILPVVLGLAIWQTRLPVLIRLVLVLGLGWITFYTFFPQLSA